MVRYLPLSKKKDLERVKEGSNLPVFADVQSDVFTLKKKQNFPHILYKEIQMGLGAKLYMRKGFLIYEEMRKFFIINKGAVSHI